MQGSGPLYDELHALLELDAPPTPVHRFLASLAAAPTRSAAPPHQLIVTTNYDLALEQAFLGGGRGVRRRLLHRVAAATAGSSATSGLTAPAALIDLPNTYATELSLERRTIILKLHGQLDRTPEREWESFVVTEDDYIDYPAQADVASAVPVGAGCEATAKPLPLPWLRDGGLESAARPRPAAGAMSR